MSLGEEISPRTFCRDGKSELFMRFTRIIVVILTAGTGHLYQPVLDIIHEGRAGHGGQVPVRVVGVAGTVDPVFGRIKTQRDGRPRSLGK